VDTAEKGKIAHMLSWFFIYHCLDKGFSGGFFNALNTLPNKEIGRSISIVAEFSERPFPSNIFFESRAVMHNITVEQVRYRYESVFVVFLRIFREKIKQLISRDGIIFNGVYIGNEDDVATATEIPKEKLKKFICEIFTDEDAGK